MKTPEGGLHLVPQSEEETEALARFADSFLLGHSHEQEVQFTNRRLRIETWRTAEDVQQ